MITNEIVKVNIKSVTYVFYVPILPIIVSLCLLGNILLEKIKISEIISHLVVHSKHLINLWIPGTPFKIKKH